MRTFLLLILVGLLTGPIDAKEKALPYLGEWSNGRGETLVITAKTIQFAQDKPVGYRDITRASDGSSFQLQLNVGSGVNFLTKFMDLSIKDKTEMHSEGYERIADAGSDRVSTQTWYRD